MTEHHLFLSLKVGFTGSSESTLVKMPHCWKSLVMAHISGKVLDLSFEGLLVLDSPEALCCVLE